MFGEAAGEREVAGEGEAEGEDAEAACDEEAVGDGPPRLGIVPGFDCPGDSKVCCFITFLHPYISERANSHMRWPDVLSN